MGHRDETTIGVATRDREAGGLAWREAGDGPIVLLLHGLGGTRTAWEPQLAALAGGARVVAWDMPGYGASAPLVGPLTFPGLAGAVVALLDRLDAPNAHVVGWSMGGMIAQHLAARHGARVASLTLVATSPRFGFDGVTTVASWRAARLAPLDAGQEPADFADAVIGALGGPGLTPEARAQQVAAMRRVPAHGLRAAIDCLVTHDSAPLLGAITAPTVCAAGALDDETPVPYSAHLVEHIAGARLVVVPGAGHLLPAEAPEAVNAIVRDQLAGAGR